MRKQARIKRRSAHFGADKAVLATLTLTTLLSGTILASTYVKADNNANNASTAVVDEVRIIIPTACSLAGTIATNNEHTATILQVPIQKTLVRQTLLLNVMTLEVSLSMQ